MTETVEVNDTIIGDVLEAQILAGLATHKYRERGLAQISWTAEAANHSYHPVKQYLESLEYDGDKHIEALTKHFVDADAMFPTWLKRWLVGSVCRIYENGKQNRMLVLEGRQNLGKSYFVRWLAQALPYLHIEAPIAINDTDSYVRSMGRWVWGVPALSGTTGRPEAGGMTGGGFELVGGFWAIGGGDNPPCDPCDMNCDGDINAFDIEPFLDLLFDPNAKPCNTCTGDVNADGNINAFDIEPFLECLFP